MSHEGIRIVNAEQARREDMEHEQMPSDAVTPKKVRVKKTEGTGVEIDWKDGHQSVWTFAWLRNACPCATCHEEREKTGRLPGVQQHHRSTDATQDRSSADNGQQIAPQVPSQSSYRSQLSRP